MNQSNFAFLAVTKQPKAAPVMVMRQLSSEVEAINYDIQKSGLKQYYIAQCMGVHETLVSKWCKGKQLPAKRLTRFCEVTGSTALQQFRERAEQLAADAKTETPAQKATRLLHMEAA